MVLLDVDPQTLLSLIFAQAFAVQILRKQISLSRQKVVKLCHAWLQRNTNHIKGR